MKENKKISNEITKEIINTIDNCSFDKSQQLHCALKLIINKEVLTNLEEKEILELFKIVVESKSFQLSSLILSAVTNKNTINSGEVVEVARLINECDELEPKHAEIVKFVATNEYINKSGKTLEITKIIKNVKNKEEALTIAIQAIEEHKNKETPIINIDAVIAKIKVK